MTQPNSLKPCPHCGSPADITEGSKNQWWAECTNQECRAMGSNCEGPQGATEAWNKRARPAATDGSALREAVKTALELMDYYFQAFQAWQREQKRAETEGFTPMRCAPEPPTVESVLSALTTQKAAGTSDAGMREALEPLLALIDSNISMGKSAQARTNVRKALAALTAAKAPADEAVPDMRSIEEIVAQSVKDGENERITVPMRWLHKKLLAAKAVPQAVCEACQADKRGQFGLEHSCDMPPMAAPQADSAGLLKSIVDAFEPEMDDRLCQDEKAAIKNAREWAALRANLPADGGE